MHAGDRPTAERTSGISVGNCVVIYVAITGIRLSIERPRAGPAEALLHGVVCASSSTDNNAPGSTSPASLAVPSSAADVDAVALITSLQPPKHHLCRLTGLIALCSGHLAP